MSGKFDFFVVKELPGNSVMCQGKMKFCKKNVREMSGNFTFQPDEARMFCPDVFFLLNSLNFRLQYCQGNLNLRQGKVRKCQKILVSPKCMNPVYGVWIPLNERAL